MGSTFIDAVDQYGERICLGITKNPRKALLDKLGATHADRIFVATKYGKTKHIGYSVRGRWFQLYNVTEWEGKL